MSQTLNKFLCHEINYWKKSFQRINIVGPDAFSFLQSQVTINLSKVQLNQFHQGALLDRSGKIVSYFFLVKVAENNYSILSDPNVENECFSRLETFHISEDLEMTDELTDIYFYVGYTNELAGKGFKGDFIHSNMTISFSILGENFKQLSPEKVKELLLSSGIGRWGIDFLPGDLVNNTFLNIVGVDYSKGCFLGKETASKVEANRGAAYFPCVLTCNKKIDTESFPLNISFNGKKVGTILAKISGNHYYIKALRDIRVESAEFDFLINEMQIKCSISYLPLSNYSREEFSTQFYDNAIDHFHAGKNKEAIADFKMAIFLDDKFEDAYESLGVLYGRLEMFKEAITLMEQLKELNPKAMMAYTNLSLYHMKVGNIEVAEKFKSQATFLNFELLGDAADQAEKEKEKAQLELKEVERKRKMFLQVLELDEFDSMANYGLGEIERLEGDLNSAESRLKLALASDPKYVVAYLSMAKLLISNSKSLEAKEYLKDGIKIATKLGSLMPANEMQNILVKIK